MSASILSSVTTAALCLALSTPLFASPTVDLIAAGSSGSVNGARFEQFTTSHGAGTGHFDTFLVIQQPGSSGREEGYNTDWSPLPLDAKEPAHTHSLLLSDVPTVEQSGILYREFVLDVHEASDLGDRYLSLDQLMIGLGDRPNPHGEVSTVFDRVIYSLNSSTSENWVRLDGTLSSGGGQGDMRLLIPNSLFGTAAGDYVYLYSKFGMHDAADATPEEWSVQSCGPKPVPAPAAMLIAGLGTACVSFLRRRRWL